MATVLSTDLRTVLLALRQRLVDALGWPEERVLVVAADDATYDPHAQYLMVRPGRQRWERHHEGAGRHDSRVRRRCTVTLRTRVELDEATSDLSRLTHESLGHFAAEHLVCDALELWAPEDLESNWLLVEPLHLEDAAEAERPPKRLGWAQSTAAFDLVFVLSLTQSAGETAP